MNLFQSEWLREPPPNATSRYAIGTHARPVYGVRYARAAVPSGEQDVEAVDMRPVVVVPTPPRRRPVASFDRAA